VYSIGAVSGGLEEVAPARWDAVLRAAGLTDAYYARGYVAAAALAAGGDPVLLRLAGAGGEILMAVVVRADPVDVVTPYGYGGPAACGPEPPLDGFPAAFGDWCARRGIVSSFVVFHPLLGNAGSPAAAGWRRTELAGTVAWRLEGDLVAGMHRHHRRLYRRAAAAGMTAQAEPRPGGLDEFVALYEATMRRAGAAGFYLFEPAYWDALTAGVPLVRVDVRAADGELGASVLGIGDPPWLHYHLGASSDAGRRVGASQLALHGLADWGQRHGYELLHLGGGVGGGSDSLLEYKQRFAPAGHVPAAIGKAVHDRPAYLELAGAPAIDWDGFFPAYRAPR
jgi:serine/alanine adding enzyme